MERQFIDSGTKGIGLIPNTWESQPLVIFFSENRKANTKLESVTALQFKYGEIIQKPNNARDLNDKDRELLSKYTVIEPGDVVVNGLNLNFDLKSLRIAIAREKGVITSAYIVLRPRKDVNSEYYNYVLKALDFQKILHGMGEGIRLTLSYDELKKVIVPVPKASIQSAIVNYLKEKCGEIDSLIGLQEQMIEKLKAYKQSVITEAVTKGLNPNAKLVSSGIDWIGEIPEGWKVKPFKELFRTGKGLSFTKADLVKEGIPVISYGQVHSKQNTGTRIDDVLVRFVPDEIAKSGESSKVRIGDFIFADTSEDLSGCGNCVYVDKEIGLYAGYHSVIAFSKRQDSNIYLAYLFLTDCWRSQIRCRVSGIKVFSISQAIIKQTSIILPSQEEQLAIASYLEEKCADIDRLIDMKQQKIEKLKDYKKSVIYEAVTGKINIES
jgi:type I restriction enzyme S subunit